MISIYRKRYHTDHGLLMVCKVCGRGASSLADLAKRVLEVILSWSLQHTFKVDKCMLSFCDHCQHCNDTHTNDYFAFLSGNLAPLFLRLQYVLNVFIFRSFVKSLSMPSDVQPAKKGQVNNVLPSRRLITPSLLTTENIARSKYSSRKKLLLHEKLPKPPKGAS